MTLSSIQDKSQPGSNIVDGNHSGSYTSTRSENQAWIDIDLQVLVFGSIVLS